MNVQYLSVNAVPQTPLSVSSVLKTFIHDPLVEWEKVKGRGSSAETSNEKVYMFVFYYP